MLKALPLCFVLAGLTLYFVLAGADFGAGIWEMLSGPGERGREVREHAHRSMGPVWEANHVWLIFILTVTWTAYPTFFGSLASTLALALFIAALGIVLRGATYAFRPVATGGREMLFMDGAFAVASLITPFCLGSAAGAIATEHVPVGNAAGSIVSSWLNLPSISIGVLTVVFSAYLAAVYLAADAARRDQTAMTGSFRKRALGAATAAGAVALADLVVMHQDAHSLYTGLTHGWGLAAVIVSALAGVTTTFLMLLRRFELARLGAALAVAAVIAAWALARYPLLLPGLTVDGAAASHDTLITLLVAVLAGGVLLFPALGLLFTLTLRGRLGHGEDEVSSPQGPIIGRRPTISSGLGVRAALALLVLGIGTLNGADAPWAHIVGLSALTGFVTTGFVTIVSPALIQEGPDSPMTSDREGEAVVRRRTPGRH